MQMKRTVENTEYTCTIYDIDYARVLACTVYEISAEPVAFEI